MLSRSTRFLPLVILVIIVYALLPIDLSYAGSLTKPSHYGTAPVESHPPPLDGKGHVLWSEIPFSHQIQNPITLPTATPRAIPKIQAQFDDGAKEKHLARQHKVKSVFLRSWNSYKEKAWLHDELAPISGRPRSGYGWATTMVDSLDTLWIMGLEDDFEQAVKALNESVDFTRSDNSPISVFETTIRHLGGLLGAYDVSDHRYPALLNMATQLGEMLYHSFDTHNHMPATSFNWGAKLDGRYQHAGRSTCLAEMASLTLEFTRLAQLTGDSKYFDVVQRVTNELMSAQDNTRLPGMWPMMPKPDQLKWEIGIDFGVGALSDSAYEYLPKTYLLLGGTVPIYKTMYEKAVKRIKETLLYRPVVPDNLDILFPASVQAQPSGQLHVRHEAQHLAHFLGGMFELGGKTFARPDDLVIGKKLVDGSVWSYSATPSGIAPEHFHTLACTNISNCTWNQTEWERHQLSPSRTDDLPLGMVGPITRGYYLRPEAIESVFYHYRITGDAAYLEHAWEMFEAIDKSTRTDHANAQIRDVLVQDPDREDRMESWWLGETLKYFFLIFADPGVVSLDDFVL